MKILILDDLQIRRDVFAKKLNNHELKHVYNYSQFVEALKEKYDTIFLDHDLCGYENFDTYIDGWGEIIPYNGYDAAKKIAELDCFDGNVIIHSINPVGANNIYKLLHGRGINVKHIPFNTINFYQL